MVEAEATAERLRHSGASKRFVRGVGGHFCERIVELPA